MDRISVRYRTLSLIKAIFKDLIGNSPLCSNDTCVVMEKSGAIIRLKTVLNSQEPKYLGLRTETIYPGNSEVAFSIHLVYKHSRELQDL